MSGSEAALGVSGLGQWRAPPCVVTSGSGAGEIGSTVAAGASLQETWINAALGAVRYELGRRLVFEPSMERVGYDPCLLPKLPAAFTPLRWRTSLGAPNAVGRLSGSRALSAPSASACLGRRTFRTRCPRQSPCRSRFTSRAERDRDRLPSARPIPCGGAISAERTRRPRRCLALALPAPATRPPLPSC
jgi:hypothetical protein